MTPQCGGLREGMNDELIPYPVLKVFLTSGTHRELKYYNKMCRNYIGIQLAVYYYVCAYNTW